MQKTLQSLSLPVLYSLQGFRYCDLLLSQGKYREVLRRVVIFFEWRLPGDTPLDIAIEHLSRGRAHLLEVQIKGKRDHSTLLKADYLQAIINLEQAVEGLRQAGHQDYLSRGLLARAQLRRLSGKLNKARHGMTWMRHYPSPLAAVCGCTRRTAAWSTHVFTSPAVIRKKLGSILNRLKR